MNSKSSDTITNNGRTEQPNKLRSYFLGNNHSNEATPLIGSPHDTRTRCSWILKACGVGAVAILVTLFFVSRDVDAKSKSGMATKNKIFRHNPKRAMFYTNQLVDHNHPTTSGTYSQKYFENFDFFGGPGYPIFVIMGGEDPVDEILYPFISEHLAKLYDAYTICIEHRFYGDSFPLRFATNENLRTLLTPRQALDDAVRLIQAKRAELGCGSRGSSEYCPVMSVGASYPGFLAALLRIDYPEIVDIGYASSTPLLLYSHDINQNVYFEKITRVAEEVSPGCANAVRKTLTSAQKHMLSRATHDVKDLALEYGVCTNSIPSYIQTNDVFAQEIIMIVAAHFAEYNMEYYPPSSTQKLVQGCKHFQNESYRVRERLASFLQMRPNSEKCFDMTDELPPGPNGTISAADWSGVGSDASGWMWDFQSCTLIPENGLSNSSMFPPRPWTLEWLTKHCQNRFDYTPDPPALVKEFAFDDLSSVTHLLFTNGLCDGWSIASVTTNLSESVLAINFPNGAHHSDLTHSGPNDQDTDDIKSGHVGIIQLIGQWLDYLKTQKRS